MLSRVAERVYWMARYLERAENTARLMNVYSNLLLDLPRGTKVGWHTLIDISGVNKEFAATGRSDDERSVVRFLLSEQNGISLLSVLAMVRENARTTREIIPSEAFEQINDIYLNIREKSAGQVSRSARNLLLEEIIVHCQQLTGMLEGCLSHNHVHRFIEMGRYLERADMTTRIVDVGSGSLLPDLNLDNKTDGDSNEPYQDTLWMSVLRSLSGYQMYRQNVKDRVNADDVVAFLLQDSEFPRSVAFCLERLKGCINGLSDNSRALRQVRKVVRNTRQAQIKELLSDGLFQYIDDLQVEIAGIHDQVAKTWFLPHT
ncbi:MAG: alpha-E domain-containing protein [Gammaproteobacteria bacterium]|nr:alpha-E domain-containing protein [Pseudomonadales bacterium]MCP5345477.1 alpha-E domain-containing protein [Pseudomonadales bacterium]